MMDYNIFKLFDVRKTLVFKVFFNGISAKKEFNSNKNLTAKNHGNFL